MMRLAGILALVLTCLAGMAPAATLTVTSSTGGNIGTLMSWDPLSVTVAAEDGDAQVLAMSDSATITATAVNANTTQTGISTVLFTVSDGIESISLSGQVTEKYTSKIDQNGGSGCFCFSGQAFLQDTLTFDFASGAQFVVHRASLGRSIAFSPFYAGTPNVPASITSPLFVRYSYTAPSAVPLPAAGWLLVAGFGALAALRRRPA